jgi:gluconokinase
MVGTSGAMRVLWKAEKAATPEGLWRYRSDADRFVVGGALSDGGNLVAWLRETLRLANEDETEGLLREMEPGAHGLTFLPLLAGERGPDWADRANGAVSGLSITTTPVEILRAAMEAVALRFAIIAERLDEALTEESEGRSVVASGGGLLGSRAWTTMVADALNKPVSLSGVPEASSRGAVLLAVEALGGPEPGEIEAPLGETVEPDAERHEAYREALDRQWALYGAVMRGPEGR